MIDIDVRSRTPIYEQLIANIKTAILKEQFKADDKLPSVRELAGKLAINPNTIQKAYRNLESEGYIYSVPGRGNYVMKLDNTLINEEKQNVISEMRALFQKAKQLGMSKSEICNQLGINEKGGGHLD